MDTFQKVIPGRVNNNGIVSRETFSSAIPIISSPAHFPDFASVTPRGETKRGTVSTGSFNTKFGDTTDAFGLYYNPVTLAIQKLGAASQASFGFKRLVNNDRKARAIIGVGVFSGAVPNYERDDATGGYALDIAGNPIVSTTAPTVQGVWVCPGVLKSSGDVGTGKTFAIKADESTPSIPADTAGTFYPLVELISGIGDDYNSGYAAFGHQPLTDWNEISAFITENGAYPFIINMGTLTNSGLRVPANTVNGTPDSTFTMFDVVNSNNVRYGISSVIGNYTGNNVNRQVQTVDAPFESTYVYNNNIAEVAKALYAAEYTNGSSIQPVVNSKRLPPYAIMNMFDLVNHNGVPYQHVVFGGNFDLVGATAANPSVTGTRISLNHYLQANGGINPYADNDGKYPDAPTSWVPSVDGDWVVDITDTDAIISTKQCWEMNQMLYEAWLIEYSNSLSLKDVIRNRTSFIWDLGYKQSIKNQIINMLSKRKDFVAVLCATEWLRNKSQDEIYSTATMLNTRISMIPESEIYQSHACRAAINLWDARVIDEVTWGRFSLNIDLMYAFAIAGGGLDGRMFPDLMPDHKGNRTLRVCHDPQVEFEADDPAANNLINGNITVTPLTESLFCRPALPSVYDNINSVLKDLTNVWKCVCVEKILQDIWITVSGDPQMAASEYLSKVKDEAEARILARYGSVISSWEVVTSFREASPTSKSVMYATTRLWLGKGYYMLDSILEAYNEDSLDVA
jgi:hypothetical protein